MSFKTSLFLLLSFFMISCSDSTPDKLIVSYSDDLNSSTLATNSSRQYSVYVHYDDSSQEDISDSVVWSSSDTALATVKDGLLKSGSSVGVVDISYVTQEKLSDGSALHKNSASISIEDLAINSIALTTLSSTIIVSKKGTVNAIATYADNSTGDVSSYCDWNSSNPTVASVDSNGVVSAMLEGNTTIVAKHKDTNISSSGLLIEVVEANYKSITISADKTIFNVEQSIAFEAQATTHDNQIIILDASELDWSSSDSSITVDTPGVAYAELKGDATITAILKADTSLQSTMDLTVLRDEYMRLFDENGTEIEFELPHTHQFTGTNSRVLGEFTIKAVGENFTVRELEVKDFSGVNIASYNTRFVGLLEDDIIVADTNRTFEVEYEGQIKELVYSFKINDNIESKFIQRYQEKN